MKLWVDDIREMPDNYTVWCRTAEDAIAILLNHPVTEISLDHDLGEGQTGYTVAKFIEESAYNCTIAPLKCHCHSANPVGKKNIQAALNKAKQYWKEHNE